MSMPDASSNKAVRTTPLHTDDTRLNGRWLLLARLVCFILCMFSAGLFTASILSYLANRSMFCTGIAAPCNAYGQLTPGDMQRLHELGLSLDFFATYTILLVSIPAIGYWLVAVFLLWRKSNDRVALLAAVSLALYPIVFTYGLASALPSPWWFLAHIISLLGSLFLVLLGYVFPSGHFVPRWTRWVMVVALLYWGFGDFFPVSSLNPFNYSQVLNDLVYIGMLGGILAVQIYRYRRVSTPVQRQQTKWVVYGGSIGWGGFLLLLSIALIFPASFQAGSLASLIEWAAVSVLLLLFPFSLGLAILRSRLWDIDVIINRTLVYGTLTATLALLYVGLVIGLQALLSSIISQGNSIAIVISTLVIAAIFMPLRHRIQQVIDRRFYRSKYNAAKTLAAFSTALRHEVDLDQLKEALLSVVQETMEPAHVSLWLRPGAPDRQDKQTS